MKKKTAIPSVEPTEFVPLERLLTFREAWEYLHVSRSYLYKIIQRGELPIIEMDGVKRIAPSVLRAYMQEHMKVS